VRVLVAIPDTAATGRFTLTATLADWHRAAGGIGPELSWTTKVEFLAEIEGRGSGNGSRSTGSGGDRGAGPGSAVALRWSNHEAESDWGRTTVGDVDEIAAEDLAATLPEYRSLAVLGQATVPTIALNEEYPPFKRYLETRSRALSDLDRPRDRYATGVGLALLVLHEAVRKASTAGRPLDGDVLEDACRAAARGVLAVMPHFDDLISKAGLDPNGGSRH
jgi:hypothetical protein